LRSRAEAWASAFEANARMDVMGALALEHITLNGRKFTVAELMRDLLDAGAPVKLPRRVMPRVRQKRSHLPATTKRSTHSSASGSAGACPARQRPIRMRRTRGSRPRAQPSCASD
jgi:hypothetical protein